MNEITLYSCLTKSYFKINMDNIYDRFKKSKYYAYYKRPKGVSLKWGKRYALAAFICDEMNCVIDINDVENMTEFKRLFLYIEKKEHINNKSVDTQQQKRYISG